MPLSGLVKIKHLLILLNFRPGTIIICMPIYNNNTLLNVLYCIRFGKLLWLKLPKDAFDNPWDIEKFVKFLFTDNIHSQVFNTE